MDIQYFYKKIKLASLIGLLSTATIFCHTAIAQSNFVIGVQNFEEYLPYSQYSNSEYSGFNKDLLDLFAKTKNYTFTYTALPINRLYSDFVSGKVDFKYPDNEYWSRDKKVGLDIEYSSPIVYYIDGVITKTERLGDGVEELKQLETIRGYTPFIYLKKIKEGSILLSENSSIEGLLQQTERERIDGAYFNVAVAKYYLRRINASGSVDLAFDRLLPHSKGTRHLSSYKYPQIIAEFNAFFESHKDEVEKLKKKYLIEDEV